MQSESLEHSNNLKGMEVKKGPVIIVEDDRDDQELIAESLKDLGGEHELRVFFNGKEALDYLNTTKEQPFIIICDINMPIMDGFTFRQLIQSDEYLRRKSIPFVFLSTDASPVAVIKAYDLSVQGFFKKPTSFDSLRDSIKMMMDYWTACRHVNSK